MSEFPGQFLPDWLQYVQLSALFVLCCCIRPRWGGKNGPAITSSWPLRFLCGKCGRQVPLVLCGKDESKVAPCVDESITSALPNLNALVERSAS